MNATEAPLLFLKSLKFINGSSQQRVSLSNQWFFCTREFEKKNVLFICSASSSLFHLAVSFQPNGPFFSRRLSFLRVAFWARTKVRKWQNHKVNFLFFFSFLILLLLLLPLVASANEETQNVHTLRCSVSILFFFSFAFTRLQNEYFVVGVVKQCAATVCLLACQHYLQSQFLLATIIATVRTHIRTHSCSPTYGRIHNSYMMKIGAHTKFHCHKQHVIIQPHLTMNDWHFLTWMENSASTKRRENIVKRNLITIRPTKRNFYIFYLTITP